MVGRRVIVSDTAGRAVTCEGVYFGVVKLCFWNYIRFSCRFLFFSWYHAENHTLMNTNYLRWTFMGLYL